MDTIIVSEKARDIDIYIQTNYHSPKHEEGKWPIEIAGRKQILSYYRFPIKLLKYNKNNGRLAMDVLEWETQNQRKLDPDQTEDAIILRNFLLELDKTQTDLLKKDLFEKGQMEPGVITHDGYVINGNRRMALFEYIHSEEPIGKWEYLEAVRLPQNITSKDLWKIEAGLQLSRDKISEYHPVNELLKIKEGIDAGLDPKEVAASMYGRSFPEIEEALDRLNLIDQFLDFFGQPKNYGLIKNFGLHEYFIDIQKTIITTAKQRGISPKKIKTDLEQTFALIRADIISQKHSKGSARRKKGITHWDIRELGKIFLDNKADMTFKECFIKDGNIVRDIKSILPDLIIEGFKSAKEVIENKEDKDKPILLIQKAIKALESIDKNSPHFQEDQVKLSLNQLIETTQGLLRFLNKN